MIPEDVTFDTLVEIVGRSMETAGIAVIIVGAVAATVTYGRQNLRRDGAHDSYRDYRRALGRSILLGLEFLVAGDIIRTVVIEPDFQSVGVLALIVLIRTFLSAELEMEIDGRWPWQRQSQPPVAAGSPTRPRDDAGEDT